MDTVPTIRRGGALALAPLAAALLAAGCGVADPGAAGGGPTLREVHVDYSWTGWGALGYTLSAVCGGDGDCRVTSTCQAGDPAVTMTNDPAAVAWSKVQGLAVVLQGGEDADGPAEVLEHTDDYPVFDIRLVTEEGEAITVRSTSNTQWNLPWNVLRDGQWQVNGSEGFPHAYAEFLRDIAPTGCWG